MDVFNLAAKLTLDSSSFTSGLKSAESQGNGLSNTLNKVTSAAKKVASALVLKEGISAMKNLATQAAAAGDKIDKQSQALNMSREAYQEWDYILSQAGGSIDSLGVSMKTLNNSILSGSDSVEKLGLSFEDLGNMSLEEQFEAVVRAFQDMPESAEKSALAVELFGRNGLELLPLLNSSSDTIDTLRQRFEELGIAMSDDMIDSAVNYTDAMDTMQRTLEAAGIAIGSELLPTLTEWVTKATNFAGELLKAYKDNGIEGVFDTLNQKLSTLIENLKTSDSPFLNFLGNTLDDIQSVLSLVKDLFTDFQGTVSAMKESDSAGIRFLGSALDTVKSAFEWIMENQEVVVAAVGAIVAAFAVGQIVSFVANLNPVTIILAAIAAAATLIVSNWEDVKATMIAIWDSIKTSITSAWEAVTKWWQEDVAGPISEKWEAAKTKLTEIWESIKTTASETWESIKTATETAWKSIKTAVTAPIILAQLLLAVAWESIKNAAETAWNAIKTAAETTWNAIKSVIIDPVQNVIDKIQELLGLKETKTITVTTYYNEVRTGSGGSHGFAKGEWNIPYDNFPAILHRGERVLTASQARQMDDGTNGMSGTTFDGVVDAVVQAIREGMQGVHVDSYLDGRLLTDEVNRYQGADLIAGRFA